VKSLLFVVTVHSLIRIFAHILPVTFLMTFFAIFFKNTIQVILVIAFL